MKYIVGLLLLAISVSCINSYVVPEDACYRKRVSVGFSTAVPLPDLPSTKAVADDVTINDYAVWVFSDGKFVEAIYKSDKYTEDAVEHNMVTLKSNGDMFIMLPDGLRNVTLAMVANMPDLKGIEPSVGADINAVNAEFVYSAVTYMPMYGVNNEQFNVAPDAYGGVIVLRRAMARIEVDASKAEDHFTLQKMYVYYPNYKGTLKEIDVIANEVNTGTISGNVSGNKGYVYLTEINISTQAASQKSCIILEGLYKGAKTYYKLDFIGQTSNTGSRDIQYYYVDNISRNFRYVFDIQYLTAGTGYSQLTDALSNPASNIVPEGNINLIRVYDQEIKDITTNNYIYLGVTSSQLQTTAGVQYHVANLSIVTNSERGWKFESESLPEGVHLSINEYVPQEAGEVVSVWVYLDKTKYSSGDSVTLYVYGENIRKSVTITVS